MGDNLPPGFRFYPTEEELVSFYLHHKLEGGREDLNRVLDQIIPVLDIYHFNPWDLPQFAGEVCKRDEEQWFFFIPRQESEARGGRPKRVTSSGYWKATGSPTYVYSSNNHKSIAIKRSMVFYTGRAPTGTKTQWKMNEYKPILHVPSNSSSSSTTPQLSLCRIYKRSKSSRSFDRRPQRPAREVAMAAQIPAEQQATSDQQNIGDQFVDHEQNPPNIPPLMEERGSSPESYSSEDHHHGDAHHHLSHPTGSDQPTNNNNIHLKMDVDDDDELVWDWNHLNWL